MRTRGKILRLLIAELVSVVGCFAVLSASEPAMGQLLSSLDSPAAPAAPTHLSECDAYTNRMRQEDVQLSSKISQVLNGMSQRCAFDSSENDWNYYCAGVRYSCPLDSNAVALNRETRPYEIKRCQVQYDEQIKFQTCIQQVKKWQSEHPEKWSSQGILTRSAVSYAQDAGSALPEYLTHASSPVVSGVAEWGARAVQTKQYYDAAKSLLELSNPTLSSQDRSNLMQSLGVTAAQSMPNVNPISSILMAVSVNVLNGIYLKNMQALQSEMATFDSGVPAATDPNELDMQQLYVEAMPSGGQDAAKTVSQLEEMFSADLSTHEGSEVSWSARTQQSEPGLANGATSAPPSAAQSGTDCESAEAPIAQECMQHYYGPPCDGAHISVGCFQRALQVGAGICSNSVMAGYRQSLEQAREAVALVCR